MINGETTTINNGRYYYVDENNKVNYLPSVTTILGHYFKDEKGSILENWRNRIGHAEADKISKFSANRGTMMHSYCENFMSDKYSKLDLNERLKTILRITYDSGIKEGFTEDEIRVGRNLFYNFYNANFFLKINKIIMQETMLHSLINGGYAGRVDKIYESHEGDIIIADYKTSKKPKSEDWIKDYKMQISAYYFAYWEKYGKKPYSCEIWISNELNNEPQMFILYENDIKYYFKLFLKAVQKYHTDFDDGLNEYLKINLNNDQ